MSPEAGGIPRRTFLAGTAAALGGGILIGASGLAISRAARSSSGGVFFEPEVRSSVDGVLNTTLRVARTTTDIGGESIEFVGYEGQYPGPTLEIDAGDTLKVHFDNQGEEATNLHVHGLHVSTLPPSDEVLLEIAPGTAFDYEYHVGADHPAGTYWYHAHMHGKVDNQVLGGMFGLLIIRGAFDEIPGVAGVTERVVILSEIQLAGTDEHQVIMDADKSSTSLQNTLVNGRYQPVIEVAPGQTQRWRILNTASVFHRLQLDGHQRSTIAIDGNSLVAPVLADAVEIPPGGRVDVLASVASPCHRAACPRREHRHTAAPSSDPPASCAAECAQPVASNASKMSMISL